MSFWSESLDYNDYNKQFDIIKDIQKELNEFIEKSFLEIYESLKPEQQIKNFTLHFSTSYNNYISKNKAIIKNRLDFEEDEFVDFTIAEGEEDLELNIFNSKLRSFSFFLETILEKITFVSKKDFTIDLKMSKQEFIQQCDFYKDKYENNSDSYFSNLNSVDIYNSFFNNLHFNRMNCFCNLVTKYGKDVYLGVKKDKNGDLKECDILPYAFEKEITEEFSFKSLLQLGNIISFSSDYVSHEEMTNFSSGDEFLEKYYQNNYRKALSEFQKNQILKNLEERKEIEPVVKRRI